jgi:hypothetical protein
LAAALGCSPTAKGAEARWRRVVLVELYTSQGCSSCPPADAFVRELPRLGLGHDRVIPLTFHVHYWDRLGWKDPFASTAFTDRQNWYASSNRVHSPDGATGLDGLYTPQMIVDGTVQFSGQRRATAAQQIERAAARPPSFDLSAVGTAGASAIELTVRATALAPVRSDQDWRLSAALVQKETRTAVLRGENAGESLAEAAVVRALSERLPLPPPGTPLHIHLPKPVELAASDVDLVVFVQSEATREIGAADLLDGGALKKEMPPIIGAQTAP